MLRSIALPAALLLIAGCSQQASEQQPAEAGSETPIPSPAESDQACAPVRLDVAPDRFADGRENFTQGQPGRMRLAENFEKAYAEACAAGWLSKMPLVDPRSKRKDTLYIANAPEANAASIYFADGATYFEGPFYDRGGHVQFPGPAAIKEAIYCHAVGATEKEQAETGRCLPD